MYNMLGNVTFAVDLHHCIDVSGYPALLGPICYYCRYPVADSVECDRIEQCHSDEV